ncbi:MAG TPA: hypothetical protein VK574_11790 [Terracidiphilus sp.]|jgi:hypothetical protein|nr:hypothetical protein [Terracidiphilus sp.]
MIATTRSAPNILLMLCSTSAILMTFTGLLFLIGTRLLAIFAHGERFVGEIDAISIALIFGGIAVALKTIEIRLRAEQDSSTD